MASKVMSTALKGLHIPGKPVIFTNVWYTVSARAIAPLASCKALATASYAIAIASNTTDEALTYEQNLKGIQEVIDALLDLDVAGFNLEDYDNVNRTMYSKDEATERVRRTMAVAKQRGDPDFVLNARCDSLLHDGEISEVIERGHAYFEAGATTVFVWGSSARGVRTREVERLVEAFRGRLSVKLNFEGLTVKELAQTGVARVSVGPSMQQMMIKALAQDAEALLQY